MEEDRGKEEWEGETELKGKKRKSVLHIFKKLKANSTFSCI